MCRRDPLDCDTRPIGPDLLAHLALLLDGAITQMLVATGMAQDEIGELVAAAKRLGDEMLLGRRLGTVGRGPEIELAATQPAFVTVPRPDLVDDAELGRRVHGRHADAKRLPSG
jgi:hypothetical protein